jgi:hypothetical protein
MALGAHRHGAVPAPLSRAGCSRQFGRASAPMMPHRVPTMRGPNVGTGTWSGQRSALSTASWWHRWHDTASDRTPLARMLASWRCGIAVGGASSGQGMIGGWHGQGDAEGLPPCRWQYSGAAHVVNTTRAITRRGATPSARARSSFQLAGGSGSLGILFSVIAHSRCEDSVRALARRGRSTEGRWVRAGLAGSAGFLFSSCSAARYSACRESRQSRRRPWSSPCRKIRRACRPGL